MKALEAFFRDIDARWKPNTTVRVRLQLIGSAALLLQTDYERGTKDSDVLRTPGLSRVDQEQLLELASHGTRLHQRHGLYIELVGGGIPLLPHAPAWREQPELNALLRYLHVEVLDIVDVVVSKLKRFHAADKSDISAMVERGLVPHERLVARFVSAVNEYADGAGAGDVRQYIEHFHRVEMDEYGVGPTPIELPSWLDED